jgi:predicted ATP-grasp superfamily ATP-dependent carboligase
MDNLKEFQFPLLFKCINGTRLTANKEPKMIKVNNETELIEAHDQWEVSDKPNFMLQEYIPGGEDSSWIFNGFFDGNSHCVIGFTGKKIRQHPAYMGAASLGVCLQNDELNHITCRFMKAIGYQGVLDIDYCYDYRDGKYKVLDVNPRIGSSFRLFVDRNGMDVARALYLSLTNQPVLPLTIHEGRKWVVENQDISSCLVYRKDGNLTLKEFLASFKGLKETAWIASDDMQPFLKLCKSYFKKLFV